MPEMISSCGHPKETFLAPPLHTGPYWDTLGQVSGHSRKTWHQMGSAGFGFVWLAKEGVREREWRGEGWGKTEWGSRSQLEGRKRELHRREAGLRETKTTPAYHKRASRRKADSCLKQTKHVKEREKKNEGEGFAKASFSNVKDDNIVIHHLHPGRSGIPPFRAHLSGCMQAHARSIGGTVGGAASKLRLSSAAQLFSSCFVFVDLRRLLGWLQRADKHGAITSAWLTSSNMRVCCFSGNPS